MKPPRASLPLLLALFVADASAQKAMPAAPAKPDAAAVKQALQELQAEWPKWAAAQRTAALARYQTLGSPEVAVAVAHKLTDPSPAMRRELAAVLGQMKQPKTIPQLAAALVREESRDQPDLDVFVALCQAFGAIGDPQGIAPLVHQLNSGDRQQPEWLRKAEARVAALGQIRHKDAVDELISLLARTGANSGGRGNAGNARVGRQLERAIERALQQLTGAGQQGEKAWRDWWREKRATFKF